jgi:hypothetical protein
VLGYREERLSLGKILDARFSTCEMKLRFAWNERFPKIGFGVFGEVVKSALDVVACVTGLDYRLLRRRALPMREEESSEWEMVWRNARLRTAVANHARPALSDTRIAQTPPNAGNPVKCV